MDKQKVTCAITQRPVPRAEAVRGDFVRPELLAMIRRDFPDFSDQEFVSTGALNDYRRKYMAHLIREESKEISDLEREVLRALENDTLISENMALGEPDELTFGQRVADKVASFGGSWTFILLFFLFLLAWMAVNIWLLAARPFDPYPFILLNLILSCLAAIQAPVIMMSQNRQESKDRLRSEHDFKVNLKAELEIRLLHEKLDHLIIHQNQKLLAIQEMQLDYLEEIQRQLQKG